MRIFIIILNWNGKKDTIECLHSLTHIKSHRCNIVVIDNGSKDDSVAEIRRAFPFIPILETGQNLGFAEGNNVGIRWALHKKAEWILLLNNDTVVDPLLIEAFLQGAAEKSNGKVFGAKIYRYKDRDVIDHLGGFWKQEKGEFISWGEGKKEDGVSYEEMKEADYVCGAALFAHRSVFEKIGFLEPRFFLFWEETDFCMRAKRAGFEIWTVPKAKIWHKVSASFVGGKPHTQYFWWRSRLLWIERNCSDEEKRHLYQKFVVPELWKALRHYFLRSIQAFFRKDKQAKEKALRCKASCAGALHYWTKRFGNCPDWLIK